GNAGPGVSITGTGSSSNTVINNIIGLNLAQTTAIPNSSSGVEITLGASNNKIGGGVSTQANEITGNLGDGILISGSGTNTNTIVSNFIGVSSSGLASGNQGNGIFIRQGASQNIIGGNTAADRNIISANLMDGIRIDDSTSSSNSIIGNFIGL